MNKDQERFYYFDYLRFVATLAVVLTHTAADVVTNVPAEWGQLFSNFNAGNLYDTISRFAVNIFFMISGALLLNPNKPFNLPRQWFKIFWPLVIWSALYVMVNMIREGLGLKLYWSGGTNPVLALQKFFMHELVTPLWFVYSLLGCYLAVPLFRCATGLNNQARYRLIRYLLILWLISTMLLPTVQHFLPAFQLGIRNDFLPFFLGLFLCGYALHRYSININTPILLAIWLITNIAMFIIIYYERSHGLKSNWAWGNHYPFVFFNSLSIFLLFKKYFNIKGKLYKLIKHFSLVSFQLYLAHAMVLGHIFDWWPASFKLRENAFIAIPLVWLLTAAISFLIASFIHWAKLLMINRKTIKNPSN